MTKLHRLICLPNGQVHEQYWAELPTTQDGLIAALAASLHNLRCDTVIPIQQGRLRVVWIGSRQGGAIGSFYLDDQLFLCTMLASGLSAEEDQVFLTTTGRLWDQSEMVRGLMEGAPSPFLAVHEIKDRPLLVGMLIPMLPPETYAKINGIELAAVATYFAALTPRIEALTGIPRDKHETLG
jgi:hypothetical protein